jgi:hypothetical protein
MENMEEERVLYMEGVRREQMERLRMEDVEEMRWITWRK